MKIARGRALKKALLEAAALPEPRPAEAFWQDFRARASLTVQQDPATAVPREGTLLSLRWASVTLGLLLALAAAIAYLHPWTAPLQVAGGSAVIPPPPATLSKVEEVDVLSEYSSVMIVEDTANGGTVIWVASADTAP